jgi:hypothetical protein
MESPTLATGRAANRSRRVFSVMSVSFRVEVPA